MGAKTEKKNVIVVRYSPTANSWRKELRFWTGSLWVAEWQDALKMSERNAEQVVRTFRTSDFKDSGNVFDAIEDYGLATERTLP